MCPKTRSIWRFFVHFVIKKWPKKADLAAIGCAQWELLACQISARSDDFCILKGVGLRAVWFLSIPRSDLDYPVDLVYIFTSKGRVTRVDGGFRNPTIWNVDHAQTHLPAGGGFSVESRVFDTTTTCATNVRNDSRMYLSVMQKTARESVVFQKSCSSRNRVRDIWGWGIVWPSWEPNYWRNELKFGTDTDEVVK
jgi:hypothetical protein